MSVSFGTDGIRGRANETPLTPGSLVVIAEALGVYWSERKASDRVLLGHDGRLSHDMIQSALASGLMSSGLNPQLVGLCSTPSLAFLSREKPVAGGIMISASHNPFHDNGIKLFKDSGEKLTEEEEGRIEELIADESSRRRTGQDLGRGIRRESWLADYTQRIAEHCRDFPGHVVLDCANGGASRLAPAVLEQCTRELTLLNADPDGTNINEESGSLHPEVVAECVREEEADLGFALDGDGDRAVAVDEEGRVTDGDVLMYLLARAYSREDELDGDGVVMTSMSNLGLRLGLEEAGLAYEVVGVGDRLVYAGLQDVGWRIGGEQSGHVIDRDWLPTGDGLNTIVSVMNALVETAQPLSHWRDEIETFPQVLHNIDVNEKPPLEELPETRTKIESVEEELGREGRVLVRYSGTEPVARIMLEGADEEKINRYAASIGEVMRKEIHGTQEEAP